MKVEFRSDELVTKNGKSYPVVGGRLRVAHDANPALSIKTEFIQFEPSISAVIKAELITEKGTFTAYGASSVSKDERLSESLLELAETRAIARALRFAGYGVEMCGSEEIPSVEPTLASPAIRDIKPATPASRPQIFTIEKIATLKKWSPVECCRRILHKPEIQSLDEIDKDQASEVISRMKEAA